MNNIHNENQNKLDVETENELKKIKLSLEHGMDFSHSFISPDLRPETEGQLLNYIQKWEDQYAQRKMTTVNDMGGRPSFTQSNEIPEEEISANLQIVMELLNKHSVKIDTLCAVDDKELYRFITEELLYVTIPHIQVDGMMHCFIYEEFYPNHVYDISNRCSEFIQHLADIHREEKIIPWGLADQIAYCGQVFTKEELNQHIISFRELFGCLTLTEFSYLSVTVNESENEATTIAFVHYSSITKEGQTVELTGNCIFNLRCEYGWWNIHQLTMPWNIVV